MSVRCDSKTELILGNRLVEEGVLPRRSLEEALKRSAGGARTLMDILSDEFGVDEGLMHGLLTRQTGLPSVDLSRLQITPEIMRRVPIKIANHYRFVPLWVKGGCLTIASDYPMDIKTQDEIRMLLGMEITQVLAPRREVIQALRSVYGMSANTVDKIISRAPAEKREDEVVISAISAADEKAADASVINLVNEIILEAFRKRATDIHLEPYRGQFRLRYRIDGMLNDAKLSEKARGLILPVISRIKIMSNLNIVEHRLPQDGRAVVQIGDERLDLRVSCIPTPYGESIVVRVLKTEMTLDLNKLGLEADNVKYLEELITRPHGIILLTGPTGSGKTTTLYACLNRIKSDTRKIISLEDPIEYEIPGITQIQVRPKVGLDFAKGLRSMLRHDPDIMMVGEIRDLETAEIAIRAALTGHLIFSTLHTNDAASGVARLLDIGVEPFLAASSVQAIIAQRLVRVICEQCKEESNEEPELVREKIRRDIGGVEGGRIRTYRGRGCQACNFTGFYGRLAIHEVMAVSEPIQQLVLRRATAREILDRAVADGMQTLTQDGWRKVLAGRTTADEVIKAACTVQMPVSSGRAPE